MRLELADYYADNCIGFRVQGLSKRSLLEDLWRRGEEDRVAYHEAKISPLVEEIPIDINTVRLAQVLRDNGPDGRQVFFLERMFVLNVSQFCR